MSSTTKLRVSSDEFISLEDIKTLPYLKHVELTKCSPRHFGLEKWTRLFVIPDNWMRKIYKDEVWKDTELPEQTSEPITMEQKRLLYEWLFFHSPIREEEPPVQFETRGSRTRHLQYTDLQEMMKATTESESEDECDNRRNLFLGKERSRINNSKVRKAEPKIPICYGHKIQPEFVIFERAIRKMKSLSDKEEAQFKMLINDVEYMKFLENSIGNFLGITREPSH